MSLRRVTLKSAGFMFRLSLIAAFGATSAFGENEGSRSSSLKIDVNTYLVGFDHAGVLLILSIYDELAEIIGSDGSKSVKSVSVGSKMTASAAIEKAEDGRCWSYFVGLQTEHAVFEFVVVKDEIDGSQTLIFVVADSDGGCPPIVSSDLREYSLRSLLVNRDNHRNHLFYRPDSGDVAFEKANPE